METNTADLDQLTNDTSSFITDEDDRLTMDDLVEKLIGGRTWKYTILLLSLNFMWLAKPSHLYISVFAGMDPSPGHSWTCVSQRCEDLINENSSLSEMFPCFTSEEKDGTQTLLLQNVDIEWNLNRTSFSVEFDLYCNVGSTRTKKTLVSSIFFAGALTGLFLGGFMFDHIGRKKTATFGYIVLASAVFCGTLCHNYGFLLAIRYFQGIGDILLSTGMTILSLELTPARFRNYIVGFFGVCLAFGFPIATGLHYFIPDWNFNFLGASVLVAIFSAPVFTCIESPRFYLINKDFKSARRSLKALASLSTSDFEFDKMDLENLLSVTDKMREQTLKQQLMDLRDNPTLLCETLVMMFLWFCGGLFFFGFNFGWAAILPNIYQGYLLAGVGQLLSAVVSVPLIAHLGRRRAMMTGFLGAGLFYLLAIPEVGLGGQWTLEMVSCLIGFVFVSGCFGGVCLWTGELAPTSHRGLVVCACFSASRIGSFLGPYIFNNLAPVTYKAVPLGGLALLSVLCAAGSFLLVETGDKKICLTGEDVVVRRKKYFRYMI